MVKYNDIKNWYEIDQIKCNKKIWKELKRPVLNEIKLNLTKFKQMKLNGKKLKSYLKVKKGK